VLQRVVAGVPRLEVPPIPTPAAPALMRFAAAADAVAPASAETGAPPVDDALPVLLAVTPSQGLSPGDTPARTSDVAATLPPTAGWKHDGWAVDLAQRLGGLGTQSDPPTAGRVVAPTLFAQLARGLLRR
jgi:hypothetical protein